MSTSTSISSPAWYPLTFISFRIRSEKREAMYIICWSWAFEADVPVRFWMWEDALVVSTIEDERNVSIHSRMMYIEMNIAPTESSHHIFANCLSQLNRQMVYPINGNIKEKRLLLVNSKMEILENNIIHSILSQCLHPRIFNRPRPPPTSKLHNNYHQHNSTTTDQ